MTAYVNGLVGTIKSSVAQGASTTVRLIGTPYTSVSIENTMPRVPHSREDALRLSTLILEAAQACEKVPA